MNIYFNYNNYDYEEFVNIGYDIGLSYLEFKNEYPEYKYDLLLIIMLCSYNIIIYI